MSTQERRKYPRIQLDLPLQLTLGDATIRSRIFDISTSGIRFKTPEPLTLMSRVQLAIQLPTGGGTPLALSGVVVRSATTEAAETPAEGAEFETAIFFDDLTDKMHGQLTRFLESQW
ncbi:MAG: PilZ domain-containing protein [Planctomycetota bacterium]|jgi:hypothetical protein